MHPFKRAFLIAFFGIGTVGGFAHGFAHVHGAIRHCSAHHEARRAAFEQHVANVCVRAAERAHAGPEHVH